MNGAEALVATLADAGVDTCFTNPGTSEMHFVAALGQETRIRPILCLFEGVATGAADGYARMLGKPATTLLHLGPGLANGLANLHNARRAASPIVNIVGDHATYHAQYDAPLSSDVAGFARPVSGWVHASQSPRALAADGARAVAAALEPPGQIATLIVPADVAWLEADGPAACLPTRAPIQVLDAAVVRAADGLRKARRPVLLVRGEALGADGLWAAARVATRTGARLVCDTFAPRIRRGAGLPLVERIPYFAEAIVEFFQDTDALVLVGAKPPVSFFAYPGKPSFCLPADCAIIPLAHGHEDGVDALQRLADALGRDDAGPDGAARVTPDFTSARLNPFTLGQVIARHLPDEAIICDESGTVSVGVNAALPNAAPHDHLALTGGSIGQAGPLATGAAVAHPDRKVLCLQGDGGAMYTLQALWTQARERLNVTTVIFANRSYGILNVELKRVGAVASNRTAAMLNLTDPTLSFHKLADGMGVAAVQVASLEAFDAAFKDAMASPGPRLIEVVL